MRGKVYSSVQQVPEDKNIEKRAVVRDGLTMFRQCHSTRLSTMYLSPLKIVSVCVKYSPSAPTCPGVISVA